MMQEISTDDTLTSEIILQTNKISLTNSQMSESGIFNESSRLQAMELEQEQLNASLLALTTHFGQVQFRLKQIVAAPDPEKHSLLKELEEFAFQGCPINSDTPNNPHDQIIQEQRLKQKDLIHQLKGQLQDIENFTNQSDNKMVIEKQKIIINELKEKINLPLDNLDQLSNDELKKVIDNAVHQIVNPTKVKEQLVTQLKTQIEDLERFISFLQGEASSPGPYVNKKSCACNQEESAFAIFNQPKKDSDKPSEDTNAGSHSANQTTVDLLKKILSMMQIFAISQLNCGARSTFEKNSLKKTSNHWGDLRANLELAVNKVLRISANYKEEKNVVPLSGNCESEGELAMECPHELVKTIRKDLACSLRDLMQHGLVESSAQSSLVPFGCFVVRSKDLGAQMHIWDLLVKYYDVKHGKEFTQSAANKLSQSFSLNVVGGKVITIKQSLLNSIETVLRLHNYDGSAKDSCFKAFVCLAINEKKLAMYLKQILKATVIIENYYQSWSYVKSTGFDDALKSIDQLKCLNWNVPVEKSKRRRSTKTSDLF